VIPALYAVLALDIANERVREAQAERLARAGGRQPSAIRSLAARVVAAGGLALTAAAARLDRSAVDQLDHEAGASA
jgi:hypothetical protein